MGAIPIKLGNSMKPLENRGQKDITPTQFHENLLMPGAQLRDRCHFSATSQAPHKCSAELHAQHRDGATVHALDRNCNGLAGNACAQNV